MEMACQWLKRKSISRHGGEGGHVSMAGLAAVFAMCINDGGRRQRTCSAARQRRITFSLAPLRAPQSLARASR